MFSLRRLYLSFLPPCLVILTSCHWGGFQAGDFKVLSNMNIGEGDTTFTMKADLSEAVLNGIEVPTRRQSPSGNFQFTFRVKNGTNDYRKYYYKIFYQNESYKFADTSELAHENFYGSWSEARISFKPTKLLAPGEEAILTDSFRIVGNPRNERKYYGASPYKYLKLDDSIRAKMGFIASVDEWMKSIRQQAKKDGTTIEEQVYLNALWLIGNDKGRDKSTNNRWKRNPRMGDYRFMLVVSSAEDLGKIPLEVRDLQRTDSSGKFANPFAYFLIRQGKTLPNTHVMVSPCTLRLSTALDLGAGIYVDKLKVNKSRFSTACMNENCNNSMELFSKAQFSQHFHNIDKNFTVYNVPEVRDVVKENFTRQEYESLLSKYASSQKRVKMFMSASDCPCKTVSSDKEQNKISMVNPAVEGKDFRKEHVGIASRLGFTYGKFRAKLKFPELLSADHVWNGITNAFWLLFQEDDEWNQLRECNAEIAYIPKSEPDNEEALKRTKRFSSYSEIDFEIVKESAFWPKTSYKSSKLVSKSDDAYNNDEIMVTCTNWDLACHQPPLFNIGAQEFEIDGGKYVLHRWHHYYKALTTKIPVKHDEIFKAPYYYFEIEWRPDKILWKIGPEKDKLRVICVMNNQVTSVPNNQMILMFTQEWHNEEWWPTAPYRQNFIPFPKSNIKGEILEIEIE